MTLVQNSNGHYDVVAVNCCCLLDALVHLAPDQALLERHARVIRHSGGLFSRYPTHWTGLLRGRAVGPGKDLAIPGELRHMALSPNGSRLACCVKTAAGDKLVLDGRESVVYTQILTNSFAFSADSRRFGYLAYRGPDLAAVVEEPSQAPPTRAAAGYGVRLRAVGETADSPLLQISADGQHVAHVAITNSQFCVVHDGRCGKAFRNGVAGITLSPDFLDLGRLQPLTNRLAPAPRGAFASAEEWESFSEFCR